MKKSAVLFSGGIDSVVLANMLALTDNLDSLILFDYSQATIMTQMDITEYWSNMLNVNYNFLTFPFQELAPGLDYKSGVFKKGFSPDKNMTRGQLEENAAQRGQDWSFIPGRNAHFLLHASIYAHSRGCNRLFVGFQENEDGLDKLTMPDRPLPRGNDTFETFIKSMNEVIYQSIGEPFVINAPFMVMDKTEIVRMGINLGINFDYTYSCEFYPPCGKCDQCNERNDIFNKEGISASHGPE